MQYRQLGRTGVFVSPLCLGTMNFGGPTAEDDAIEIIRRALDAGINFIDTANVGDGNYHPWTKYIACPTTGKLPTSVGQIECGIQPPHLLVRQAVLDLQERANRTP